MSTEYKNENMNETIMNQPFDTMGLFTFLRTYARRHDEADPRSTVETWNQTITRVVESCNSQLHAGFTEHEKKELYNLLFNLKCSVAGRFLWQLGTNTVNKLGLPSLQNCAQIVVNEPIHPFTWAMNFLMLGSGVGYRILPEDMKSLPVVKYALVTRKDTKDADFVVPDSREGWVKLLAKTLKAHFYSGTSFTYSCVLLRSKGAPIKNFGGLASGPDVLCDGIDKISSVLNKRAGQNLRPVDALDIMNIIGMIVVSGNVRRCLPKGALVHTEGGLVPIEEVQVGDRVLTSKGYERVSNKFIQGTQSVIKIKTEDGEFVCTPNHKMAVQDENGYQWKEAATLTNEDCLILPRDSIPGKETKIPNDFCELDTDIAWLTGYCQNKSSFPEILIDKNIIYFIQSYGHLLKNIDMKNTSSDFFTAEVPQYILQGTEHIRTVYLCGLFKGNPGLQKDKFKFKNAKFCNQVQSLFYSLGIHMVKTTETKLVFKTEYDRNQFISLDKKHCNNIRSELQLKLTENTETKENVTNRTRVVSINPVNEEVETFDIEVENAHEFFCNGYLTHNSAQIALGSIHDKEYLQAKRWDLGNIPNWRAFSNNSIVCDDIKDVLDNEEFWKGYDGTGEPYGLINLKLSRACGRLGDFQYPDPEVDGYNPCLTGDTLIHTNEGLREINDLVGKPFTAIVNGKEYSSTEKGFWKTGTKPVFKMILENGLEIKATDNHKFLTRNNLNNEWRQVIELKVGDVLNLSDNTSLFYKDTTLVEKLFNSHKTQITNDYNMCIVDCENIKHTQILLFAHGVYSSIRGNDLIVARDCIKQVLFSRKTIDFVSKISSIEPCGEEDVYDCTINEIHCFSANGIIAHNCAEISLANHQTCCLAELYLPNIKSYEELISCATYLYRICKHSLTLPCADSKETEQIVHKQMRMGIGVTGYLQSTDEQRGWLKNCYEYLRKFDKDYSNLHGFPLSIKLTTVKPSGSLSILGNCTPGIHPGFSKYYKRRVRIASESPLIALAKSHGYHVEYVQNFDGSLDHSTQIVTFPMSLPDHTVFAENCSAIDQLEWVKKAQTEWSDNSVSVTVYYRKHELPVIKEWLKQNYNTCIKTVSFLLHNDHGFKQAPMEQITKEEYEELARNCRPIQNLEGICFNQKDMDVMENEKECAGGACPRR